MGVGRLKSTFAASLKSNDNMSTAGSPLRLKVCLYFASKLHPFNSAEEHHSPKMREADDLKQGAGCTRALQSPSGGD